MYFYSFHEGRQRNFKYLIYTFKLTPPWLEKEQQEETLSYICLPPSPTSFLHGATQGRGAIDMFKTQKHSKPWHHYHLHHHLGLPKESECVVIRTEPKQEKFGLIYTQIGIKKEKGHVCFKTVCKHLVSAGSSTLGWRWRQKWSAMTPKRSIRNTFWSSGIRLILGWTNFW